MVASNRYWMDRVENTSKVCNANGFNKEGQVEVVERGALVREMQNPNNPNVKTPKANRITNWFGIGSKDTTFNLVFFF